MSDSRLDIERDKIAEYKQQMHFARQDYCKRDCEEHNAQCFYYDPEQETLTMRNVLETQEVGNEDKRNNH